MGWARALAFGEPMHVGYLPDMFGHVAQMPQILRRAGIGDAVRVARRAGSRSTATRSGGRRPDGSWVRAEYMPSGYGNAAGMFAVPDRLDGRGGPLPSTGRGPGSATIPCSPCTAPTTPRRSPSLPHWSAA